MVVSITLILSTYGQASLPKKVISQKLGDGPATLNFRFVDEKFGRLGTKRTVLSYDFYLVELSTPRSDNMVRSLV